MSQAHGLYLEDLEIGQSASVFKTVSDQDIRLFAEITGDTNPVHLDEEFAAHTQFKTRIAHGMFSAGLISAVLGTHLPGPGAVYLDQSLKFRLPIHLGDEVETRVTVTDINLRRGRVTLSTECFVAGKRVTQGEALVMVDKKPAA
ncbi:MaoC family dehydratase [Marinobacterium sedimentorum]|uniref:MaoC family dehydratase n=1 Tax=Marinobacterium sedimentorum TaxID=2927804 RepID=UPI0020C6A774|nr:MaoC family dehydratase [Marinobacterium sedimentorum]MCP8687455.1 MaoC family dehydratase [Marinobacterium sedimentorum]